uniref:Uncharacterized protein n=1 Tax=Oryza nivara TaxID=4536 RepID=A0A0E0FK99_ORYNI
MCLGAVGVWVAETVELLCRLCVITIEGRRIEGREEEDQVGTGVEVAIRLRRSIFRGNDIRWGIATNEGEVASAYILDEQEKEALKEIVSKGAENLQKRTREASEHHEKAELGRVSYQEFPLTKRLR